MKNGKIGFCGIFAAFALAASLGLSARADSENFYADENGVLHIVNRAGLMEFRDQANTGALNGQNIGSAGHTKVQLEADIDLNDEEWTPIVMSCIDFDGGNHIVSNLKVTGNEKNVGLFGEASISTVKNLTVSNAVVVGINHVAAIAGDGLCGHFINCKVYNATVTTAVYNNDDGDKAGAICGYLSGESDAEVTNCTVEKCTITGYRDIGGAVGYANGTATVTGTTVKDTKVVNDRTVNYKNYTTDSEFDVHEVIGETNAKATVSGNTTDNVTIGVAVATVDGVVYPDLHDALDAAKTAGKVCTLLCNVDLTDVEWIPVAGFNGTFDGNGYTISHLTVNGEGGLGLFANTDTSATIKDLTITDATITSTSGNNQGVLAGSIAGSTVSGVKIIHSTVSGLYGQYVGGICGSGYPHASKCEVASCTLAGKDQVGGLVGYLWVGGIEDCVVTNNAVSATEERAGGLIGKFAVNAGNLGSSTMFLNGNTISGTATAPDMAGGIAAQIMGDDARYEMRNNDIDVVLSAAKVSPIGILRANQDVAFTGVLEANITGTTWSDATTNANSYTYTAAETKAGDQVINRDNPSVIVETGDEEGEHQAQVVTKKSTTEAQTASVPQEAASITTEKVTVGGKTTTVAEQIEQTTKVEGVKLTTNETVVVASETLSGVQAVVSEAKLQAIAITNEVKEATAAEKAEAQTFAEKIVTAAKVEVKVEVTVTPTKYVKPVSEQTVGTMAFKLEPKATVKIIENDVAVATQVVDVGNDMIDTNQPITVSLYTGFAPVQIVHSDDDGNFIEAFSGDAIGYDAATGIATVEISHFSNLTAYEEEQALPIEVTPETVQAVLDSAKNGTTIILTAGDYGHIYLRNNGDEANRIMQNVTIKAKDGAAVTVEQIEYERVNGKTLDIENLTIDGITFSIANQSAVLFDVNGDHALRVNGLTVQNCTKVGDKSTSSGESGKYDHAAFIDCCYDGATDIGTTFAGDETLTCGYHNIQIISNSITSVFQPIKFPNEGPLYGLTVTGNTFTDCLDNHFMVSAKVSGEVVIANNTTVNMTGRFARFSSVQADAAFTVTNNTVTTPLKYDTGNDGSIFKLTGAEGFTVTDEDNSWTASTVSSGTYITYGDESLLPVAEIVETGAKYWKLQDAIYAANGKTVKLLADVSGETPRYGVKVSGVTKRIDIYDLVSFTLDLNGHTWDTAGTYCFLYGYYENPIDIIDSSEGQLGAINFCSADYFILWGALTIEAGTYNKDISSYVVSEELVVEKVGDLYKVVPVSIDNAKAYLVTGESVTNFYKTAAGALMDAEEGDSVYLNANCSETAKVKIGTYFYTNGYDMTGTIRGADDGTLTYDEVKGAYSARLRTAEDPDGVATVDYTSDGQLHYFSSLAEAVECLENGTTVTLLKDISIGDSDYSGSYMMGNDNSLASGKTINGNGHTLTYTGSKAPQFIQNTCGTITNMTFAGMRNAIAYQVSNGATFVWVKTSGSMNVGNNSGAFAIYISGEVTFRNCEMAMKSITEGGASNYNGAFAGYGYTSTITFENCKVTGCVVTGKAGMFLANCAYKSAITLKIKDTYNEGLIQAVVTRGTNGYNYNPIMGYAEDGKINLLTVKLTVDDVETSYSGVDALTNATMFAALTRNDGKFLNGPTDATLAMQTNDQGGFVVTTATRADAVKYVISTGLYTSLLYGELRGGSSLVRVSETFATDAHGAMVLPALMNYRFVDASWVAANPTAVQGTHCGYITYTLNDETFYYVEPGDGFYKRSTHGQPASAECFSISAYDADNNLLSAAQLSADVYSLKVGYSNATESVTYLSETLEGAFDLVSDDGVIALYADNEEDFTTTAEKEFDLVAGDYGYGAITPAEGYALTEAGDGVWHYGAATPVAKIGDTEYTDLQTAINAAQAGDTIQMIANVDYGEFSGVALSIAGDRNITLDLAGCTISGTATNKSASELILVNPGANLTITNSTVTEGVITYSTTEPDPDWGYGTSTILNKGTLTLNAGKVVNTSNGGASYAIDNNTHISACTFIMNGGKAQCDSGDQCVRLCAISGESVSQKYENRFEMHGGEIVSGGLWVNMNETIGGSDFPAEKDWATVIVDGGTINGGIDLVCRGTTSITLGDATYNVTRLRLRKPTNLTAENEGIFITGGKWSIDTVQYYEGWTQAEAEESGLISVSGGIYTEPANTILAGFAAEGYEIVDNTDEETKTTYPYAVVQSEVGVCQNLTTTKQYDDLATAIDEATAGDTIQMIANFTLPASVELNKSITLDLNGKVIDGDQKYGFWISSAKDVVIDDASGNDSGKITNCQTPYTEGEGGAIEVISGTLTLNGGSITGNTAVGANGQGGGVFVNPNCTFTMNGGKIVGNTAGKDGGGVQSSGTFNFEGGVIANNYAAGYAGGVAIGGGEFTIAGGFITNNVAHTQGGGVHVNAGTINLEAGSISDNLAETGAGGGLKIDGGTFTMTGGVISGNRAPDHNGGGIYLEANATLEMTGGTICTNSSGYSGAGIMAKGTTTFTAGTIEGNIAGSSELQDNTTTGGGLYFSGSKNHTIGGDMVIRGNVAGYGGGIGINLGSGYAVTIAEDAVIKNNSANYGGGAAVKGSATLYVTGGTFTGNAAVTGGDSIYRVAGTLDITGGKYDAGIGAADTTQQFIKGGIYTDAAKENTAAALIASGMIMVANGDSETKAAYPWAVGVAYEISFTQNDGDTVSATMPEAIVVSPVQGIVALPKPTYIIDENNDKSFTGWIVKDSTGSTGFYEFVASNMTGAVVLEATWVGEVKTVNVEVTEEQETPVVPIKVTDEFLESKEPGLSQKSTAEIQTKLNEIEKPVEQGGNGLKVWENYVLGITADTKVGSSVGQGSEKTVPVDTQINPPDTDTGFTVSYQLDKVNESGDVEQEGTKTAVKSDLGIDLDSVVSNALFKVKVTIKSDKDNSTTECEAENSVGVMKVTAPAQAIVAVPWSDEESETRTADELVQKSTLSVGDTMQVYDTETKKYVVFQLDEDREWYPLSQDEYGNKIYPEDVHLERGSGVWLERQDTTVPIIFVGQYSTNAAQSVVEAPSGTETKSWNIIASPSVSDLDLNEKFSTADEANDQIIVPAAGAPKSYTRDSQGKWGYDGTVYVEKKGKRRPVSTRITDDVKIPAGTGFWYLRGGDRKTIEWAADKQD